MLVYPSSTIIVHGTIVFVFVFVMPTQLKKKHNATHTIHPV